MKILKIIIIVGLLTLVGCSTYLKCPKCPKETAVLQGYYYCNDEFKDIFIELKEGELDNPENYFDPSEWEKIKKYIIFEEK